jgi:photosystem II stability/assembly factor-like uncharacterized protein
MKPRAIGPAGMSGRVTAIDAVHTSPNIIYIGTASGGLWRSTSGGIRWEPVFDDQPVQAIGAVAIDQANPSVIWAGTGEGNPRNSANSGNGIYRSPDGGNTWQHLGLTETKTIHRIHIDPRNSDVVYVAAMGSAWGPNPERGVYKTSDGGKSWRKVLYRNDSTGCADLEMDPANPNKLIAALWTYGRKPWTFHSGGEHSGIYISHDGGETWEERTEKHGLPKKPLGRTGLAIAHNKPNVVYALVEAKPTGLYRSDDGGKNWKLQATENIGNRPFYYADIFVDPQNENRVFNLYTYLDVSEDGGKTFRTMIGWNDLHVDHHAFYINPLDPNFIMAGNDGGMGISRDGGKSWQMVENLPLAQYYHINYDMDIPYNIYGGMQDNGSWVGPAYVWQQGGIRNLHFREVYFGDGFDVVPYPGDSRYGYAMSQGGNVSRFDRETGQTVFIKPIHPENTPLRFNWNAGIAQDPFRSCGLYFGSQYLHYSTNCGDSWQLISPDLTTNNPAYQRQAESGGITIDATQAENYTTIVSIEPSTIDSNVIWVGTDDGNVQVTRDKGKTWANVSAANKGLPKGTWIHQVVASPHAAGEAFVVANDYMRNDWRPYAFHTTDYGKTWRAMVDEKKVYGHAWAIVQDPKEPKLLFLGTDHGLYFSLDKGATWHHWKEGYPAGVPTRDLKIHPREGDLIIGTFGRSAYIMDDLGPLRALAREGNALTSKPMFAFDVPDAYLAQWNKQDATHFPGHASFEGENRPGGARLSLWLKDTVKPENYTGNANWDKVFVFITDEPGDTVRRFTTKPIRGLNRFTWNLTGNSPRFPSWQEPKPDADPPGNSPLPPGTYNVHFAFGTHTASTRVKVHPDPRLPFSAEAYEATVALATRHFKSVTSATKAFDQIKEAFKSLDLLEQNLLFTKGAEKDSLVAQKKMLTDSLHALSEIFTNRKDFKGYDHVTVRLNNLLYDPLGRVSVGLEPPGATAEQSVARAEEATRMMLERVNRFFGNEWAQFEDKLQRQDPVWFKRYEPIPLD